MEKMEQGFSILKWFVDLNAEAKAVIAIMALIIVAFGYSNYTLNQEVKEERIRYDTLSDKYANGSKDCGKDIEKITAIWTEKYDNYRNLREAELKALTKAWEDRYNEINRKITRYEKIN